MRIAGMVVAALVVTFAAGCDSASTTPPDPDALPDPLRFTDGGRVSTRAQWPARREELLELFRSQVYGRSPGAPQQLAFTVVEEDPEAMGGTATLRRVAITSRQDGRDHSFELVLFVPHRPVPVGAFLLINNRDRSNTDPTRVVKSAFWPAETVIARGYAIAAIQGDALAVDDPTTFVDGAIRLFEGDATPRPPDAWKMIGAWAWGASRSLDYLVTDPMIDPTRVAVIGHSRGGKAALWAGAQDERFGLTISNESGCGGAALSRNKEGETVEIINAVFPHWFADNFRAYASNEAALPIDQHELIALVAPRGVVVGSAADDSWSDPPGEYRGLANASSVYALWGFAPILDGATPAVDTPVYVAPRSYHLRAGPHDLTLVDWEQYLGVADELWPR